MVAVEAHAGVSARGTRMPLGRALTRPVRSGHNGSRGSTMAQRLLRHGVACRRDEGCPRPSAWFRASETALHDRAASAPPVRLGHDVVGMAQPRPSSTPVLLRHVPHRLPDARVVVRTRPEGQVAPEGVTEAHQAAHRECRREAALQPRDGRLVHAAADLELILAEAPTPTRPTELPPQADEELSCVWVIVRGQVGHDPIQAPWPWLGLCGQRSRSIFGPGRSSDTAPHGPSRRPVARLTD